LAGSKIIAIENPSTISLETARLKIVNIATKQENYVAVCDIMVLIIANNRSSISTACIALMAEQGGIIVFVDNNYLPVSMCFSNVLNKKAANRPYLQAKNFDSFLYKRLWMNVIKSKIMGQYLVLETHKMPNAKTILNLVDEVIIGDFENTEALAAKYYFNDYFAIFKEESLLREKQNAKHIINICLNYGYAIIRAMMARTLASNGLILSFGLWHSRKDNAFNLVEDMVEPYRYLVDLIVIEVLMNNKEFLLQGELNPALKKALLTKIYDLEVKLGKKTYKIINGMAHSIDTFCNILEKNNGLFLLPNVEFRVDVKDLTDNFTAI
jgi:CRISPR-associated protein Cas1